MIISKGTKTKVISIASATLIGVTIIFLAVKGDSLSGDKISASNNNWQDSLRVIPTLDATSSLAVQKGIRIAENISAGNATSTTDLLSRKVFSSYVSVMKSSATGTALTDEQAAGIANELIKSIPPATTTIYTLKNVRSSSDNSKEAIDRYSRSLSIALNAFLALKPAEIPILTDAFATGDAKKLAPLAEIIALYKKLEKDLIAIETPTSIAPVHLRLIQAYANIRGTLTTMRDSFNDPVAALIAISQYNKEMEGLSAIAEEYKKALKSTQR